jgi:predicted transposase YbfD/YdcC
MGLPDSEFAMARSSPAARTALPQVAREFGCVLSDLDDAFELEPTRLRLLLDHLSRIEDPREPHRVAHPLGEILLLAICGTIVGCDDYDAIADWGEVHLGFLREILPFHYGVPGGRWLTIMMNRINPALFAACFTGWVRACWPELQNLVAIDGKTLRRSHDRAAEKPALHLVSAFATTGGLVLGQEVVSEKANELSAIPVLLERLAENDGLKGATVSIDAIACNGRIAQNIRDAGAHYLLAVKANQPGLRQEIENLFMEVPKAGLESFDDVDKGHGRIEQRKVTVARDVDWLNGMRRFPGELRLPDAATVIKVESKVQLKDRCRHDTRYYISSSVAAAEKLAQAVRGHWRIENQLHWVLDVVFNEDQSRLRKGHGAKNMAVVRHFALNLVRLAPENLIPERRSLRRKTNRPKSDRKTSIKRRRQLAGWSTDYLAAILQVTAR